MYVCQRQFVFYDVTTRVRRLQTYNRANVLFPLLEVKYAFDLDLLFMLEVSAAVHKYAPETSPECQCQAGFPKHRYCFSGL